MAYLPNFTKKKEMKVKQYNFLFLIVFVVAVVSLGGCRSDKPANDNVQPLQPYEELVTNQDTVAVIQLVDRFFGYIMEGHVDDAAAMLYVAGDDIYDEPMLMDNEEMAQVRQLLETIDIQSYRIDYIKFSEAHNNEVKVTAVIEEAHDGMPDITTAFYFKPQDYLTNWVLCLADSYRGQDAIVDNDSKDSLTQKFQNEVEEQLRKASEE